MNSTAASPMLENGGQGYLKRTVRVDYLATKAAEAEAEAAAAAAAEAEASASEVMAVPIQVTIGALLRAMDSTGGKSWMRKEAADDWGESSEMAGMWSEMQRLAKALMEGFTSTGLAPERRKKLMKHHEAMARYALHRDRARAAHQVELASLVGEELETYQEPALLPRRSVKRQTANSQKEVRVNGTDLNLAKTMNQKAQHEEAGKGVAAMNSEGSCSFIQEESENELGKRLQEIRPEKQPYAEEDYFRKAILRALLDIKEKLSNKNTDEDTLLLLLLLLKGVSNRMDQGCYDERNVMDEGKSALEACLDSNESTAVTMVESDIKPAAYPSETNPMTIQAETLRQMVKAASDSINEGTDATMVESDIRPAADLSATNSITIHAETLQQMVKAASDPVNEGTDTSMVESDIKPSADPSAINSITIQAETLQQMVKDFSDSVRSAPAIQEHMPMVRSYKLLIEPADPSATDSVTRLGEYSFQDDHDHDEMARKTADKEMTKKTADKKMTKKTAYGETADKEEKNFANYRSYWEAMWSKTCGSFEDITALSSMHFTHYTPGCIPPSSCATTPETLQIFSIKLAEIVAGHEFGWPLSVYGGVAVRDVADHNRNFLFYCGRRNAQELTQNDPFLRLIGPSRAVVYQDTVNFEIELEVKGTSRSQDKALIVKQRNCRGVLGNGASTVSIENCFCKIEFCVQMVRRTIQATILGVQVASSEQWPFNYGARVVCSSLPGKLHRTEDNQVTLVTEPASGELVMVDSKDGAKLRGGDGYLHLSRNVVSVEDRGRLDVDIQAYSESGGIAARHLVSFPAKFSKITRKSCLFGEVTVLVTVAWSLVATDKRDVRSYGALV